ncbi:MAG: DUF5606 domain-containing protein [Bacteroidales bacterium]|nr:DUF5606 domain-containing protein [Bacteroidales bacterium]
MDFSNILVVAGKPELNELVSQTKGGAIVKNLVSGQKFPVFRNDRISALGEIRLFTTEGDKPLEEVMVALRDSLEGKPTPFDPKKTSTDDLFGLLARALPTYDRERVHASDVKKLFAWYNVLLASGKLEETEPDKPAEAETPAN